MTQPVFSIQDETGTVSQLTIVNVSPGITVSVGDTGTYVGTPDEGTNGFAVPPSLTQTFKVTQVLSPTQISVNSNPPNQLTVAYWPANGTITWASGANNGQQTTVDHIDGANAYMSVAEYLSYWLSRGVDQSATATSAIQTAIVQATDYLDQKYKFSGTKLVQNIGASNMDANAVFLQPWLYPGSIINIMNPLTPATSSQSTEFPRQGLVDGNGLTVNGIPAALKRACAELASRVIAGTALQPDYDPNVVTAGAVVQSVSEEVGPIKVSTTYDTKVGLGFFPSFPHVTRILRSAGLLSSGGRRTVMR